ncbi:hypothetical protein E4V01_06780 [Methylorubrum sp. Q1]|uniref:hypothetical protein n=1 Tax=Methylorubrum sp. Q1 TaxID=2562453 RepID=UPI001075E0AB|nr:hypothetical protein [Methylorubrum sp. Q1]TFZ59653.1 hypothetical protein E4V01_06780 [Methylorubrum sp. Q1]
MRLSLVTAVILALGIPLTEEAGAQGLQPGMRTMIQRGGTEGLPLVPAHPDDLDDSKLQPGMRTMIQRGGSEGVQLGALLPRAYDPYFDGPAYDPSYPPPAYETRPDRRREPLRVRN